MILQAHKLYCYNECIDLEEAWTICVNSISYINKHILGDPTMGTLHSISNQSSEQVAKSMMLN